MPGSNVIAAPPPSRAASRSRASWLFLLTGWGALILAVVAVLWIVVTGLLARSHLNQVRAELPQLRSAITSGNTAKAHALAKDITRHAERAHWLTTGPAWWVTSNLPGLGTPLQTSRIIAAQADRVGQDVLPGVLDLAADVSTMHLTNSAIDLRPIAKAAPELRSAAQAAHAAVAAVDRSSSSWLGYVSTARGSVLSELGQLDDELSGADRATQILLPMLGQSAPQRYFIGFENEAEARGLGGLPGAFAIVTADHGRIAFTHFENDSTLGGVRTDLDLGAEFNARYRNDDPANTYTNSDISPHFPDAARIWAAMWEKKSGEHVDGAIAIDPTALSYLLAVTGPASLPDGSNVSSDNVVALTQQTQYSKFSDVNERKAYLVEVAKAVSDRLIGGGETVDLIKAAAKAAGQRRIVVWHADPTLEAKIVASGYGGVAEGSGRPFTGFVVVNATGSKLDYYLDRAMTYHRTGCGAGGTAVATFTMTNHAPSSGLPPYVTIRADGAPPTARPGDNRLLVTYYASPGAQITAVTLNGKTVRVVSVPEHGLVTATLDVELPIGQPQQMTVTVAEPAANEPIEVLKQPLVRPMPVSVSGDSCR